MAAGTGFAGLEVGCWHAAAGDAVMAVATASLYFVMVDPVNQRPVIRQVTAVAVVAAGNVVAGFGGRADPR